MVCVLKTGKGELRLPVVQECGCVRVRCHRVAFREVFKRKVEEGEWKEEVCFELVMYFAITILRFFRDVKSSLIAARKFLSRVPSQTSKERLQNGCKIRLKCTNLSYSA